ncbi:MAG: 50S ribosomal protein L10 [Bifidobacterium bifidum]|nr:50S ribosomal protein L10 [Bifidobacterium bifidum]
MKRPEKEAVVAQLTEQFRNADAVYLTEYRGLTVPPTAITFVKGDFIEAAKTLRDFAKTNKALVISGGYADGTVYDGEGATKLADMMSRPQLLSKFAGDLKATTAKAAYLFVAVPTKAVRTIDALREKQEKAA